MANIKFINKNENHILATRLCTERSRSIYGITNTRHGTFQCFRHFCTVLILLMYGLLLGQPVASAQQKKYCNPINID